MIRAGLWQAGYPINNSVTELNGTQRTENHALDLTFLDQTSDGKDATTSVTVLWRHYVPGWTAGLARHKSTEILELNKSRERECCLLADLHGRVWGCSWRCGCVQDVTDATFDLWPGGWGSPADSACQCADAAQPQWTSAAAVSPSARRTHGNTATSADQWGSTSEPGWLQMLSSSLSLEASLATFCLLASHAYYVSIPCILRLMLAMFCLTSCKCHSKC